MGNTPRSWRLALAPRSWIRQRRRTVAITLAVAGVVAFGVDLAGCLTASNVIYDDSGLRATFSHEPRCVMDRVSRWVVDFVWGFL